MATYDLTNIVDWVRRAAGDSLVTNRETYTGDGAKRLEIRNDGYIRLREVEVDDLPITDTDYTLEGNLILWATGQIPDSGSNIYVVYDRADRSDSEYIDRLVDAARELTNSIHINWTVSAEDVLINDVNNEFMKDGVTADNGIEKLMVYLAAVNILREDSRSSAKDSISIRDGDTSIETGRGATNIAAILKRAEENYQRELNYFRSNRFAGSANPHTGV